jgi:hypothetical protein
MLEKDELKRGNCRKGGPAGTFRLGADSAGKVGFQQGGLKTSHSDTSHSDGGAKHSFLILGTRSTVLLYSYGEIVRLRMINKLYRRDDVCQRA